MSDGENLNPIDAAAEITDAMMNSLADVVKTAISTPAEEVQQDQNPIEEDSVSQEGEELTVDTTVDDLVTEGEAAHRSGDHKAALSVGIPLKNIWIIVWSVAGLVALVAGIMWGSKSGVQFSLSLIALKALPVLILGGFTSVPGAIVGGLIIGVGEKVAEVYWGPLVDGAIENWFAYVVALVFLLFRPQGLFGDKIIERV